MAVNVADAIIRMQLKAEQFQQQMSQSTAKFTQNVNHMQQKAGVNLQLKNTAFQQQTARTAAMFSRSMAQMQEKAQVRLQLNTQAFQQKMAQMRAMGGGSGGGGGGMLSNIAGLSMGVATGAIAAAGAMELGRQMKGVVQQGIAFNAQMQQSKVSFKMLLGSANAADRVIGGLQTYAAATPFEMPDLTQAAVSMLATKKVGEKELLPILKKLGDAAAGSADGFASMPRIIRAVSQSLTKGKIQAGEMLQLSEAGIPAWNALAAATGKSVPELQKMSSAGQLGEKYVFKLIDGLGQLYSGMGEQQSKAFNGLTSTIKDGFNIAIGQIALPLFNRLQAAAGRLVEFMNSSTFTSWVDKLSGGVEYVLQLFDKVFSSEFFTKSSPLMQQMLADLQDIGASVLETAANLTDWLAPSLEKAGTLIQWVREQSEKWLAADIANVRKLADALATLSSDPEKAWEFLKTGFGVAVDYLAERMEHLLTVDVPQMLQDGLKSMSNGIATLLGAIGVRLRRGMMPGGDEDAADAEFVKSVSGVDLTGPAKPKTDAEKRSKMGFVEGLGDDASGLLERLIMKPLLGGVLPKEAFADDSNAPRSTEDGGFQPSKDLEGKQGIVSSLWNGLMGSRKGKQAKRADDATREAVVPALLAAAEAGGREAEEEAKVRKDAEDHFADKFASGAKVAKRLGLDRMKPAGWGNDVKMGMLDQDVEQKQQWVNAAPDSQMAKDNLEAARKAREEFWTVSKGDTGGLASAFGELLAKGSAGAAGLIGRGAEIGEDALAGAMIQKKPQKTSFVGFEDLGKSIQGQLGGVSKDRKLALKHAADNAKHAKDHLDIGKGIKAGVEAMKDALDKKTWGLKKGSG